MALMLVVDDDPAIARALSRILESAGHTVLCCGSAHEALATKGGVELAVIDVMMPGMSGTDLARELLRERPTLPIVFVTGAPDLVNGEEFPDALVIAKPWRVNTLLDSVQSLLRAT